MKYAVVIPAKNEQDSIEETLLSIVNQSLAPQICVVVDDGSTDRTPAIVKSLAERHEQVRYHKNENRDSYKVGGHVVEVFNIGKGLIDEQNISYDYIIKMDADLSFERDFMQRIFDKYGREDNLGIISGTPWYYQDSKKVFEYSPIWHTHGQFKIYNRQCLQEMGGIKQMLGWDCADNIQAIEAGWKTLATRDINYLMHRRIGNKSSLIKGRINQGKGAYNLRYDPFYMIIKLLHDLFKPPYVVGSLAYLYGYVKSMMNGKKDRLSKQQRKILRRLLWSSFLERAHSGRFFLFQVAKRQLKTR